MVGRGSSGHGGEEGFTGRAAIGYDHGYDGEVFYLGLALDPHYIDGWVEGNAGHDLPYLHGGRGEAEELRARGMPLGLMPSMSYEEKETLLQAG